MGRSFSFALVAGVLFAVVIIINIIASANLKPMDDHHMGGGTVKNLVLFVGSGMGPASITLARSFQEALHAGETSVPAMLSFEPYLTATLRTRSLSNGTTDAAAAASAMATGKKTANGMAAVDKDGQSLVSILEKAKQAGLKTGFVTTDKLNGPVAAAFTVHMKDANMYAHIPKQQLSAKFDLLMGGGKKGYNSKEWSDASYAVLTTPDDLSKASKLPVLGVFADDKLEFAIDQKNAKQPTLAQMTEKALALLHNDKGFVLVVESGNIDSCAYANDPACVASELLALQKSYDEVANLVNNAKDTVCLVAADRESGGLLLTSWDPSKIVSSSASATAIAKKLKADTKLNTKETIESYTGLDISDAEALAIDGAKSDVELLALAIGQTISSHVGVTWSANSSYKQTDTAVDVNLYVCGDSSAENVPRGNVDNTAVGVYMMKKLPNNGMSHGGDSGSGHSDGGHHH